MDTCQGGGVRGPEGHVGGDVVVADVERGLALTMGKDGRNGSE